MVTEAQVIAKALAVVTVSVAGKLFCVYTYISYSQMFDYMDAIVFFYMERCFFFIIVYVKRNKVKSV